ncbi:MAG TPA: TetR/AcrR family transcriptional regulator [Aggregatilineales bacterium]|nr:TetR/AcrR family transcriptional regulator [Aggregatilineales bacterium]
MTQGTPETAVELTEKAQHTRQHILDTALSLFVTNGYEATTLRDIASAADCSLGLAYRYFSRKEEFVLALYWQMAAETGAEIAKLGAGTVGERFDALMTGRLKDAFKYRECFQALAAAALNPSSGVNVLGEQAAGMRAEVLKGFSILVEGAKDAPRPAEAYPLAMLLYAAHFAVILFWLYDRTTSQVATWNLLYLLHTVLGWQHQLLLLPPAREALKRTYRVLKGFFEGKEDLLLAL